MVEKAFAKLNLALNIVGKKEDGFHEIETIMLPLQLHDSIEIDIVTRKNSDDDFVICDDYRVGISKYNLCHKAINVARAKWGFAQRFDVNIYKNIFLQSGLGGGSADAAAVIRGIIKLLNIKATKEEIIEVAHSIGSDVPFMVYNQPAIVTGIGDKISNFEFSGKYKDYYILLVKPNEGISTTSVYSEYDKDEQAHFDVEAIKKALIEGSETLPALIGNSLEIPAFKILPKLTELKNKLLGKGFEMVFMTGGGSCLVAMTPNKKLAKKVEKEFFLDPDYQTELTKFLGANKISCWF